MRERENGAQDKLGKGDQGTWAYVCVRMGQDVRAFDRELTGGGLFSVPPWLVLVLRKIMMR